MSYPDPCPLPPQRMEELVDALVERGFYVGEAMIDAELCQALHAEVEGRAHQQALARAGIGRGSDFDTREDIRGDAIHWLDRETLAQRRYLDAMGELRQRLNESLFLGLFEYEAHLARYPAGAFYRRHIDSFRGRANRVVSTVGYLNPDWPEDGGGEMVIYAEQDPQRELTRVAPRAGTLVCFLSEQVPHEVLPTRQPRASIAGWFRRNASLGGVVDPAR
ncbi:2OG-Fe(II) oxygenase [Halomonas sp. DN3]|uniref:2OG-Fe(II) oxygenase n=1 Tax=Halomonas sp. DN3 TaxID=2953657 RepID=UPI0020A14163|nr:2OG-Fe(II) oxygenase [Halomonas sp. DN3]USZ48606.1 2OG-Fe(II) oxygenase [Halomonas sp. DN3]